MKIGNILRKAILKSKQRELEETKQKEKYSRKLYKLAANLCDRVSDSVWNDLGRGGGCIVGLELSCLHPSQSFSMSLCGPNFLLSAYGTMGNLQPLN